MLMMIDGAFLLEFVESPLSKTVPEVYGEIAALLRKAEGGDFLVKSAADLSWSSESMAFSRTRGCHPCLWGHTPKTEMD